MRYMMLLSYDESAMLATPPDPEMFEEMGRYNTALVDAGVLLTAEGLQPTKDGVRLRFEGGEEPTVTDGPFTEAVEVVGGFWIIDVASKEEAVTWAARAPLGPGSTLTVRRVSEASDFAEIAPESALEAEETLRARIAEREAERSRSLGAEQREQRGV